MQHTVAVVHTVAVDHTHVGMPVRALCGEQLVVGVNAHRYDPHDHTHAIRCPVCEAAKVLYDLQPKLEQGRLF